MQKHPIPSVTDPLQFRAIGIVRGIYVPISEEKFTRGELIDSEGNQIDSAVLGRMITLMRNHIELKSPHLWVVYPRSREADNLHLQISGIWEPSTLKKHSLSSGSSIIEDIIKPEIDEVEEGDNYFSIRGELIFTKPEEGESIVKIRKKAKITEKKGQSFKLFLHGEVPVEHLRHFVSFNVRRDAQQLYIEDYEVIASLPSRREKKRVGRSLDKKN